MSDVQLKKIRAEILLSEVADLIRQLDNMIDRGPVRQLAPHMVTPVTLTVRRSRAALVDLANYLHIESGKTHGTTKTNTTTG